MCRAGQRTVPLARQFCQGVDQAGRQQEPDPNSVRPDRLRPRSFILELQTAFRAGFKSLKAHLVYDLDMRFWFLQMQEN